MMEQKKKKTIQKNRGTWVISRMPDRNLTFPKARNVESHVH